MLPQKYHLTPFYCVLLQGTETSIVMCDHLSGHCGPAKRTHTISHHNLFFPLHHINSGLQTIMWYWNGWYEGLQNETTAASWCGSQLPSGRMRRHVICLTANIRLWPQDASSLTSRHFRQTAADFNKMEFDPLCKYQRKDQATRLQTITSDPSVRGGRTRRTCGEGSLDTWQFTNLAEASLINPGSDSPGAHNVHCWIV